MTGACSGGRPRPCWHWPRCPRPGGRLRCTMTMRGRGGGERRGGNYLWSRAAFLVRAALAAMRPLLSEGCDAGRCRGQKTPPTEHRLRPPIGLDPCESDLVGAALAAIRPLLSAGFDASRCRGQKTPPTELRLRPPMGRDSCGSDLCGSGLGRDTAVAVRGLRFRLLSRASSLPRNRRQPCSTRSLRWAK